jgi:hypothetical protein
MKNILLLFLLSIGLFSCSSNVELAIDNPTDVPVIVVIDTLTVEIPANEVVWVEMGAGEHQITLEDGSVVTHDFQNSVYFINPTFSEYLKFEEFYGDALAYSSFASSIPLQTVNFMGMEMEGNYEVLRELIYPVTWDYGPREELPTSVEVDSGDDFETLIKLADFNEIIKMMIDTESTEEIVSDY